MEEFEIKGDGNYLKFTIAEVWGFPGSTSHSGGYDTKSDFEINSDGFKVSSTIWISTGEYFTFYDQLLLANNKLSGIAYLRNLEDNLDMNVEYGTNGHVKISGTFSKQNGYRNQLRFDFTSDQSYIQHTLKQLEAMANKYG